MCFCVFPLSFDYNVAACVFVHVFYVFLYFFLSVLILICFACVFRVFVFSVFCCLFYRLCVLCVFVSCAGKDIAEEFFGTILTQSFPSIGPENTFPPKILSFPSNFSPRCYIRLCFVFLFSVCSKPNIDVVGTCGPLHWPAQHLYWIQPIGDALSSIQPIGDNLSIWQEIFCNMWLSSAHNLQT